MSDLQWHPHKIEHEIFKQTKNVSCTIPKLQNSQESAKKKLSFNSAHESNEGTKLSFFPVASEILFPIC